MDPFSIVIYVSVLFFLIYLSGRFSGAETALTSLNEIDLLQMKHKRTKNVIFIEKLMDDMDRTIITILIGNNLVNIVASSLATLLFYSLWGNIGVSISVGALTFLLLVFGEITPKAYAIKKNRRISSRNAKEIYYLSRGLAPLISMLKVISRGLMSLGRGSIAKEDFHVQELSIKHLADKGADAGEIKDIEKDIIYRVFKFGDLKVKDAMIPGNDVKYLDKKLSAIEAKKQMLYRGYTR
ncbi:MAG: CNNM domain-containing protein, partial [Candidatus Thermoplasmatota archaeon]|nr:CNNM domain-containing protein [Candidatus Thermoplasmatota archaeon]